MSWAMVGGAVVGGALNLYGQRKANQSAQKGYDAATAEQARQYDQSRQDQMPWLQAGQGALATLQALNSGDFSAYKESPDYKFRYDQGLQALNRMAAARGNFRSGGHDRDLIDYGQGMASQGYGDFYNRQASLAGVGQTASQSLGALGQNYASNVGNLAVNAGNQRADYYGNQGNILGQVSAGIVGGANRWYQNQQAKQPYSWAQPQSMWGQQMTSGPGANVNFGNNTGWWNT